VGAGEVEAFEVGVAEVGIGAGIFVSPLVPGGHALVEDLEMLLVGHSKWTIHLVESFFHLLRCRDGQAVAKMGYRFDGGWRKDFAGRGVRATILRSWDGAVRRIEL
jgi:hypothetical protein